MDNTKKSLTVADQIVNTLAETGVRNIYAITGDSLNALTDAISRDGRLRFIHVRHEESAAFAASAEAQITGKTAVCAGSSGPGHVHLINGLYDAQRSNAPVLAIASTCPSSLYGTGYFQETDPTLLFSNCNVFNQTAVTPAQAAQMFSTALQSAISRKGVAVVGLPADVITQEAVDSPGSPLPFSTERKPEPSEEEISEAAEILNKAGKVTIFAGSGAAGAKKELLELAQLLKAPLVTTFKSQMELTGGALTYVGHVGYMGMWSASDALQNADAILIIGTNFPFPGFFPADKEIIQVDVRAERLGKRAHLKMGVRADSSLFLKALLPELKEKSDTAFLDSALKDYAVIKKKMQQPVSHPGSEGKIRPEYVFATIDRFATEDAVFTVDTGLNCVWASHYLTPAENRILIGSLTHGSMANALPQAIGAYFGAPDRQIISLSGDGGLAMLMGDLLTVIQYNLPIKILVADNRSLGYVKWEMELAGYNPSEVNLQNPDFAHMAETMGFHAETVKKPEELEYAVKRWLSADGPALLNVTTDPDAASFTFSKEMMDSATPGNLTDNFLPLGS